MKQTKNANNHAYKAKGMVNKGGTYVVKGLRNNGLRAGE